MPPKRNSKAAASKRKQDPVAEDNDNSSNVNVEQEKAVKKLRTEENQDEQHTDDQPKVEQEQTNDNDAANKDEEDEEQEEQQQQQEEESSAQSSSSNNSNSNGSPSSSSLAERMAKLKELKRRRATEVEQGNRRDRNLEFQRSKENPRLEARNARKREKALELLEKQVCVGICYSYCPSFFFVTLTLPLSLFRKQEITGKIMNESSFGSTLPNLLKSGMKRWRRKSSLSTMDLQVCYHCKRAGLCR